MKKQLMKVLLLLGMVSMLLMACGGTDQTPGEGTETGKETEKETQKETEKEPVKKSVMKYQKQMVYSYGSDKVTSQTEWRYDESGRETYRKMTFFTYGSDGVREDSREYNFTWTVDGNKAIGVTDGALKVTITYDDDGNQIELIEDAGVSISTSTFTYKDGVLATRTNIATTSSGTVTMEDYIEYDQYGNMRKQTSKRGEDIVNVVEYNYEYDKDGKVLSIIIGGTATSMPLVYAYDANGFVDKILLGEFVYQDCTCDEKGNMIESIMYSNKNGTISNHIICEYYE